MTLIIILAIILAIALAASWYRWQRYFPDGYPRSVSKEEVAAAMADLGRVRNAALVAALIAMIFWVLR